ncbi:unnamed protein product, partial [marine sediment metagenome]
MLQIQRWQGGIGNNIFQLINGICMCLDEGRRILKFPKHPFLKTTQIMLQKETFKKNQTLAQGVKFERTCFSYKRSPQVFKKNHTLIRFLIRSVFKLVDQQKNNQDFCKTLHVHIRSGDIFKKTIHPLYIQPPLSFYTTVINSQHWDKVCIVCEDSKNPCITELKRLYPNLVHVQLGKSLTTDIQTFLSAENVMYG